MRFHLTARERLMLIGAAVILVLGAYFLAVVNPLLSSVAGQRRQLDVAEANLQLASEASANSAQIADRLAQLSAAWQALGLPQGAHQATFIRNLDRARLQAGVSVRSVQFGAGAILGSASQLLADDQTAAPAAPTTPAGQPEFSVMISGTQSACVDFIAKVEALPDVVVLSASFQSEGGVTATVSGYLIQSSGQSSGQ